MRIQEGCSCLFVNPLIMKSTNHSQPSESPQPKKRYIVITENTFITEYPIDDDGHEEWREDPQFLGEFLAHNAQDAAEQAIRSVLNDMMTFRPKKEVNSMLDEFWGLYVYPVQKHQYLDIEPFKFKVNSKRS